MRKILLGLTVLTYWLSGSFVTSSVAGTLSDELSISPDKTWYLLNLGDLPHRARTRSVTQRYQSPILPYQLNPLGMSLYGLPVTDQLTLDIQSPLSSYAEFSLEMWVLEHVNTPVGAALWSTDEASANPITLGVWDSRVGWGPVKTNGPLLNVQLKEDDKYEGRWWHLVGTFDNGEWCLFVNGEHIGCARAQNPDVSAVAALGFTGHEPAMLVRDLLHEASFYGSALGPLSVKRRFHQLVETVEDGKLLDDALHITAGPWLQLPTSNSMQVLIETSEPTSASLSYGSENLEHLLSHDEKTRLHRFEMTDLQAAKPYFYQIVLESDEKSVVSTPLLTFKTAPEPNQPVSFAFLGDTEARPYINRMLGDAIWGERPDLLLLLGDLTDGGMASRRYEWTHEFFPGIGALGARIPVVAAAGNGEADLKWFGHYNILPNDKSYYNVRFGDVEFIVLDSNLKDREREQPGFRDRQIDFLKATVSASDAKWKVVLHHHPIYTADENDYGDTWRLRVQVEGDPQARKDWLKVYEGLNVDLVLYGHLHFYERTRPMYQGRVSSDHGIVYVGSGGGGGGLEDFAPTRRTYTKKAFRGFHYGLVDVEGDHLNIEVRDLDGRLRDTFTISK